ncbi:Bug family tripartite tricarboxylate transporter substrate binding protein [Pollutimonas bauzanensis]|uniref:Tripartite-type tricarboxylate transporter, receptor component TctC n=1 Tax=Pollutimonas bauzanensis TaxID=658167 RepID=A0A1M5Z9A4_9BURK|nr:tripartite tricarboxylate transporter substrate binding protein [Pollutimonas bauzanensis]SHI20762.1 Tripartite-type tricarboxylate transporter, receptor component TctC [Pollutimonas bauzanensis]
MIPYRNWLIGLFTILSFTIAGGALAREGSYPDKPVRLIVPYAPGGGTDGMARALAQKLSGIWKQKVIVDNRPGASESIAASLVARSPADGYTLLFASDSTFQLNPLLYNHLTYNPDKDLAPITRFAMSPFALFVNAETPVNSFKEFVEYAKKNRGKTFYGSYGVANSTNLGLSWLSRQFDLDMVHVPFAGQGPAMLGLLGGEIQILFGNIIPSSIGFINKGQVKVLVVSGEKRLSNAPDVPTFRELGFDNLDTGYTLGIAAPAAVSPEVRKEIFEAVATAVKGPDLIKYAAESLSIQLFSETPAQYHDFIMESRRILQQRIDAAGLDKLDS